MSRPRIVIVGGGFAGLSCAKALAKARADVLVVDRSNHHLFQPLLYQVATAGLAPTQIATPIRTILADQPNTRVIMAEATGVDLERKCLMLHTGGQEAYDYLVLATGATHGYFGRDDWAVHAPGLKSIDDALELRRRILLAFERAELESDPAEREALLTFVVVGGGPTGVELAGAIAELAKRALTRDFRAVQGAMAKVVLIEAAPRLLGAFPQILSRYAETVLTRLGVTVRTGQAVSHCDDRGVELGEETIASRTVIWAAGVRASPAGDWVEAERDRAGRVFATPELNLPGRPEVFVIGDTANVVGPSGGPLPGLAPIAKQEGAYVGRRIARLALGRAPGGPFRLTDTGSLATIGRKAAVVALGEVKLKGALAWLIWSAAHVYFLIGFRNRIAVTLDWLWSYLTFESGARLILGPVGRAAEKSAGAETVKARVVCASADAA